MMIYISTLPPSVRRKLCGLRVLLVVEGVEGGLALKKLLFVGLIILAMVFLRHLFHLCLGVAIRVNPNLCHLILIAVSLYFTVIFVDICRTLLNYKHDY